MFRAYFQARRRRGAAARALHAAVVAQARQPAFYTDLGVPDTLDGRFDMIVLHAVLLIHRLRAPGPVSGADMAQAVFDCCFLDFDRSLREIGSGDMGVGKRIKAMGRAFYGRMDAYVTALDAGDVTQLEAALHRNLYAKADPDPAVLRAMAAYVMAEADRLAAAVLDGLIDGQVTFGSPPPVAGDSTGAAAGVAAAAGARAAGR